MSDKSLKERIGGKLPPFMHTLGARLLMLSQASGTAELSFEIPLNFCHSGDIVQGGFVTAMLDGAMSMAVFASEGGFVDLPSLEIKVSFLAPSRAGIFTGKGSIRHIGKSIAFLEGELYNSDGVLTATSTSTAKVIR
ncbi:MAG: PaaI family thioesterase [Pseudomonadales bacterium]